MGQRGGGEAVARRGVGAAARAHPRRLEPHPRVGRRCRAARAAAGRADRARVFRRGSTRADGRSREDGGPRAADAARRAARRALRVDRGTPPAAGAELHRRVAHPRRRRRRRHDGLQPHSRPRRERGAGLRTHRHRRASAAWRRQPRSGAGGARRTETLAGAAHPRPASGAAAQMHRCKGSAAVQRRDGPSRHHGARQRPGRGRRGSDDGADAS